MKVLLMREPIGEAARPSPILLLDDQSSTQ